MFMLVRWIKHIIWEWIYPQISALLFKAIDLYPTDFKPVKWKKARTKNTANTTTQKVDLLIVCPSLGEYESVKAIIAHLKERHPSMFIEIAFFSLSGYHPLSETINHEADSITLLPADTTAQVDKFFATRDVDEVLISTLAIWPRFLSHLIKYDIPYSFVAVRIKKGLIKKAFYQSLDRYLLGAKCFCCNDRGCAVYLKQTFSNKEAFVTGDPRLDSIKMDMLREHPISSKILSFKSEAPLIIFASTHQKDEQLISSVLDTITGTGWKVIIAPHEPNRAHLLKAMIPEASLLEQYTSEISSNILILDQMGILKYLFQHAQVTYVGGGFDQSLHNIMEPILAENVVITGPHLDQSADALRLIKLDGLVTIRNQDALLEEIKRVENANVRSDMLKIHKKYLNNRTGGSLKILEKIGLSSV